MSRKIPTISEYMISSLHTIGSDQTMAHAAEMMREHNIRHLPVLRGGALVGVVSDRDVKLVESFRDVRPEEVTVDEAVSQEAYTVAPDAPLDEVAAHMAEHKIGSAIIMDGRHIAGIFTTVDALRALADALRAP